MAEQQQQPGELALVKAVRSLDRGGSEAIPDKLDQIWKILSIYAGGKFHAAEEMLVRWLLKSMNGSSNDAQKLRRYPLTWRILAKVFSSIPLFSLAKSLADRRFVQVLQSALKDASEPKGEAAKTQSSDTEMVDADSEQARPRKKKRSESVQFDLESQNGTEGCLRTAEALLEAVRILLARLEPNQPSDGKRDNHMGAEHVKSLFCSSATEIRDLIVPALKICQLALRRCEHFDKFDGQQAWISTIRTIWDLHLQGEGDAVQVATHFSPFMIDMHSRLNNVPDSDLLRTAYPKMDYKLGKQWREDLRRFLNRSLILPARTAFLNKGDLEVIRSTVQSTIGFSTVACSVILDLALSSPSLAGSQSAKRDNDSWAQAVFSLLDDTLQSSRSKHKYAAVQDMLNQIQKHEVSLSAESLRSVCESHALQPGHTQWGILLTTAKINADVFIGRDGNDLLGTVLERIPLDELRYTRSWCVTEARGTVERIAAGFAMARDPSTFVKIWFQHLAATGPHVNDIEGSAQYRIWYTEALCETISQSLEKTMNTKQILSLVDWLGSQVDKPAENAAVVLLLEALSQGITQDDVADAVGMPLFEIVFKRNLPLSANAAVLACRWTVARRALQWATLEQGYGIWATAVTELRETLAKGPLTDVVVFGAFKFAVAAWIANHPGGKYEDEAAQLTLSSLSQLDDVPMFLPDYCAEHRVIGYLTDMYGGSGSDPREGCPRLLRMVLERGEDRILKVLQSALNFKVGDRSGAEIENAARGVNRLKAIFRNDINTNSRVVMGTVLKLVCADMRGISHRKEFALVAEALLGLPDEAISREFREKLMRLLVSAVAARVEGGSGSTDTIKPIVSLMVKLMRRPTFYSDMAFSDINSVATAIVQSSTYAPVQLLPYLPLVQELAALTLRQMTANVGAREEAYLRLAVSSTEEVMRSALDGVDDLTVFQVVVTKTLILAIRESAAVKNMPTVDVRGLEHYLVKMLESVVEQFCSKWAEKSDWEDYVPSVSIVLGAADDLNQHAATNKLSHELQKALTPYVPQLREASQNLGSKESVDVWALRKYLAKTSREDDEIFSKLGQTTGGARRVGSGFYQHWYLPISEYGNREGILEYVDAVTADADDDARLKHIETLLLQLSDAPNQSTRLLAVHRIIQQLEGKSDSQGSRTAGATQDKFDLATVHTILCRRLRSTDSQAEFILITQILETILDDKPQTMTQWNVELTLSTVSVLASQVTTHKAMCTTPKAYTRLCRLVQVIVRRHRLRLEGHFHLLITALQSLLRAMICHPFSGRLRGHAWEGGLIKDASSFELWPKHAKAFARLLTMVCEPTPGSVARSQQSSLDSATDAAKRYAGQHMYLVLMLYIKLQLEQNVPHDVREALEPGVFAMLDITAPESRRIMNDALDASGRAIMKELYKQYLKFGKWSGI